MASLKKHSHGVNMAMGVLMLAIVVGAVSLTVAINRGLFERTKTITLYSDRAGLLLGEADVQINGVVVGKVHDVEPEGGRARMTVYLKSNSMKAIPRDVSPSVSATTLLGRKYVDLIPPQDGSKDPIREGEVLTARAVSTEVDDLLQSLVKVLDKVNPQYVSTTVGNLARATQRNGDGVGKLVAQLDTYLREFNPYLDALQRDEKLVADVADSLDQAAPDLLGTIRNLTVTGATLTEEQSALGAFILSFSNFGSTGQQLFHQAGVPLQRATSALRSPLDLLGEFSPIYPCFISNLALNNKYLAKANGGSHYGGLNVNGTILMGNPPYTKPENLPKVGMPGIKPSCYPTANGTTPPHYNFPDGSDAYRPIRGPLDFIGNPLADLFTGGR